MKNEKIEQRFGMAVRASTVQNDRTISGTAILFNTESVLLGGWFTEIIEPGAIDQELINSSDIVMLVNHEDDALPLARSTNGQGTLNVGLDANGVNFDFQARPTAYGDEVLGAVRSGDINKMSFAFTVAEGGDDWFAKPDGTYLRTIKKIDGLYDLSLVTRPAYVETSVRSKDSIIKREDPPPADPPASDPPPADPPASTTMTDVQVEEYYKPIDTVVSEFE